MDGGTGTAMGRASGEKRVELEFKQMADYRQELRNYYMATARYMDIQKIDEGVSRLTDPLDNAINEKCSRIKKTFLELMDEFGHISPSFRLFVRYSHYCPNKVATIQPDYLDWAIKSCYLCITNLFHTNKLVVFS